MKKNHLLLLLLFSLGLSARALVQKSLVTLRIKSSVECQQCKRRVEDYLRGEPGIQYVLVNYYNKIITVRYYSDRTNPENIKTAIANLGYDADEVTANTDSYNQLPPCCKKGGMAALKKQQQLERLQRMHH
ncbi:MAG: heavy-metal-associated domain-containing protein [Chitinophagaceae bacterium]